MPDKNIPDVDSKTLLEKYIKLNQAYLELAKQAELSAASIQVLRVCVGYLLSPGSPKDGLEVVRQLEGLTVEKANAQDIQNKIDIAGAIQYWRNTGKMPLES